MFGNSIVGLDRHVKEFPDASLMIVGQTVEATHHSHHHKKEHPGTPPPEGLVISCKIPTLNKTVEFPFASDATLADLVTSLISIDQRLIGCKLLHRGHPLGGSLSKLCDLGIHSGDVILVTSSDPHFITITQLRDEFESVRKSVNGIPLSEKQRKAAYEELMRILFKTDDLVDLEGELRLQRKELVKMITSLQDELQC
jgi:hypothetical protein